MFWTVVIISLTVKMYGNYRQLSDTVLLMKLCFFFCLFFQHWESAYNTKKRSLVPVSPNQTFIQLKLPLF